MKFGIKILESNQVIEQAILKALLDPVSKYMSSVITTIEHKIPSIIYESITNADEYNSLVSGQLRLELGIPDARDKVLNLIDIWIKNIQYKYTAPKISAGKIKTSISINAIRADFGDVLNTDFAVMTDSQRGYSLPWLEWLLLDGTMPIVPNYQVRIGPNPRSRTQFAIMTQSSQAWSVPSRFAGTIADNWITRAIESYSSQIEAGLQGAMKA